MQIKSMPIISKIQKGWILKFSNLFCIWKPFAKKIAMTSYQLKKKKRTSKLPKKHFKHSLSKPDKCSQQLNIDFVARYLL